MATLEVDWNAHPAPLEVVTALRQAGYEAWLAGGCVRDLLLGRAPKDFDVATSASPDQVQAVFRRTVPVKPELGVTMVLWGDQRIETTTFRTEGEYLDGRRPSRVGPATAQEDVLRRDFTVNGLLLDPLTGRIADHVGGLDDLRDGILRCIRDPYERLGEDHLRILRAVRFSVRFGMRIDTATWEAMVQLASNVANLSGERLHEELGKMFEGPFARCLGLLQDCGAWQAISPALARALSQPDIRGRMEQLCEHAHPPVPGLWPAILGLPLCHWFAPDHPSTPESRLARESLLERLRTSRAEIDAARLVWTRWPEVQSPLPRPSALAPILRDRQWPVLRAVLEVQASNLPGSDAPRERLDQLRSSIPPAAPALGNAFQEAGIPKGPKLGEAIREADRKILDEGRLPDSELVREIAEAILAGP